MKTAGLFAIVFLVMSVPAFAADVALFLGQQDPGVVTLESVPDAGGAITQIIKNPLKAGTFGVRFGGGKVVGHETTIAYTHHFIDEHSHALLINGNLILTIPLPIVKPYVTAGLGTYIVSGSGISDIGTKFAYNYGGGVKVLPGPVGVQGDIRGYTVTGVNGGNMNVVEVSIGLLFHF